jgi:hypothetical protein
MSGRGRRAAGLVALALAAAGCSGGGSSPVTPPSGSNSPSPVPTYTAPPPSLPATTVKLSTDPAPWLPPAVIANGADSEAYVQAAGLPFASEMLTVHYHAHLDINVDGKTVTVPPYIGFVTNRQSVIGLAPLHTHQDDGIIHIENSVPATFYLGQFFIEWGVRFTPTCLGAYCSGKAKELAVFVDGTRYTGDPTKLVLKKHQEIAIEYGDVGKLPTPPSSFAFPAGL